MTLRPEVSRDPREVSETAIQAAAAMIQKIDSEIRNWITGAVGEAKVVLGLPGEEITGTEIGLYLLDLTAENCGRAGRGMTHRIKLRYLVSVRSPQVEEAHRVLGELIFAALNKPEKQAPEFDVVVEPVPVEVWAVLGASPQPSFFLLAPLRQERPATVVPLVREAVVVHPAPMRPLAGVVYGPGEIPIAGARIEISSIGLVTRSNQRGRFGFGAVPAGTELKFLVEARGRKQEVTCANQVTANGDEPFEIRLHFTEGRDA